MKKKLLSLMLAAVMLLPTATFAETTAIEDKGNERAILMCYLGGKLVYSTLLKAENGAFITEIPDGYANADKKVYYINTAEFADFDEVETAVSDTEVTEPAATAEPATTPEPEATAKPQVTPKPEATVKPEATSKPAATVDPDSPYQKAADAVYAPALVTSVSRSADADGSENTSLTIYYQGKHVVAPINDDILISSAPESCANLIGQTAASLKTGDVIYITANIKGTKIKSLDLIMRPVKENIATSDNDYGTNFESIFTSGGKVAGNWQYEKYGQRMSRAKNSYVFGIIAGKSSNTLTLINKSKNPKDALDIDLDPNAYVYSCDVSGRDYEFEQGGIYDIETSLPSSVLNGDEVVLDDIYSYNYALVRIVDGTATEIVVFNNYNY